MGVVSFHGIHLLRRPMLSQTVTHVPGLIRHLALTSSPTGAASLTSPDRTSPRPRSTPLPATRAAPAVGSPPGTPVSRRTASSNVSSLSSGTYFPNPLKTRPPSASSCTAGGLDGDRWGDGRRRGAGGGAGASGDAPRPADRLVRRRRILRLPGHFRRHRRNFYVRRLRRHLPQGPIHLRHYFR